MSYFCLICMKRSRLCRLCFFTGAKPQLNLGQTSTLFLTEKFHLRSRLINRETTLTIIHPCMLLKCTCCNLRMRVCYFVVQQNPAVKWVRSIHPTLASLSLNWNIEWHPVHHISEIQVSEKSSSFPQLDVTDGDPVRWTCTHLLWSLFTGLKCQC